MPEVNVTSYILWFGVIEWVRCHLQCKGCHTYTECCVIDTECCHVTVSGYYVINIVDVMSQIYWTEVINILAVISSIGWV